MRVLALFLVLCALNVVLSFSPMSLKSGGLRKSRVKMIAEHHDSAVHVMGILDQAGFMRDHVHQGLHNHGMFLAEEVTDVFAKVPVEETVKAVSSSPYTRVDNTGIIGGIAGTIEKAIDFGHTALNTVGIANSYGFSIIIFTILVKALTLPLLSAQLESTSKLQGIAPMQKEITEKYAQNDQAKNILLAQLYQAASVNPLAGCLPALVQIPVFLSLYRALTNLIAENKLSEPFLFIPNLQGPVYLSGLPGDPSQTGATWLSSILTSANHTPLLGWRDTAAYLALPLILFVSQSVSQKLLQPPRDPNKPMTEQEEISMGILSNLPFIVAFFSINVPAGLGVYWIFNNIVTTLLNASLKAKYKDAPMSEAVEALMASVRNDSVDIDALLSANPMAAAAGGGGGQGSVMGGANPANSNPLDPTGTVPGTGAGAPPSPDFSKMLKDQREASAASTEGAREKAERMMNEAVERANRERESIDVEGTPTVEVVAENGEE